MYKENLMCQYFMLVLVSCILIGPLLHTAIYKNLHCQLFAGWQKVPIVANQMIDLLLYKSSVILFWFTALSKWQFLLTSKLSKVANEQTAISLRMAEMFTNKRAIPTFTYQYALSEFTYMWLAIATYKPPLQPIDYTHQPECLFCCTLQYIWSG